MPKSNQKAAKNKARWERCGYTRLMPDISEVAYTETGRPYIMRPGSGINGMRRVYGVLGTCEECGVEYFILGQHRQKSRFCSQACSKFGERNPMWLGGRYLNGDGYIRLSDRGDRKMEHRVVMEDALGRALERHEHVHHKNGDRADNRIENLELWSVPSQPAGVRRSDYHCPGCLCRG